MLDFGFGWLLLIFFIFDSENGWSSSAATVTFPPYYLVAIRLS